MARKKIEVWLPLLLSGVMVVGMWIGYQLRDKTGNTGGFTNQSRTSIPELMRLIREKYVDPVSADSIEQLVSTELLSHLDPHSVWLNPSDLREAEEEMNEAFKGIGVEYMLIRDTVHVLAVIPDAPAAKAGLQVGDQLIRLGDTMLLSGKNRTATEIRKLLREHASSTLQLSVLRNQQLLTIQLEKGNVPLPSVDAAFMLRNQIGYLRMNKFANRTYEEFMQQMEGLQKKGMQKLVLDLRGNGGGLMKEAIDIADEFLSGDKLIVYTQGEHVGRTNYTAKRDGIFEKGELIVLIDESSASASEVLAGALQDWDRAKIVGRRSFGKGLVQQQFGLTGGSAVRLTTARYFTPLGRNIQRPYSSNKQAYRDEWIERLVPHAGNHADTAFKKGKVFITPAGDTLYDGGGIQPNFVHPMDTALLQPALAELLYKNTLNIWAYQYYIQHKATIDTVATPAGLIQVLQPSELIWQQIVGACAKEGIDAKQFNPSQKKFILQRVNMLIARMRFRNNGYYSVNAMYDELIQQAVDILH